MRMIPTGKAKSGGNGWPRAIDDDPFQGGPAEDVLAVDDQIRPRSVKPTVSLGRISLLEGAGAGWADSDYMLNIAAVYQGAFAREWAMKVADRATRLVGERSVCSTGWEIAAFNGPGVFRNAVQAAARADIIMVSVRATDVLPLDLQDWIEAWLPLRLQLAGALVALIGVPEKPRGDCSRIGQYLQDAARRGRLDFLSQKLELPLGFPGFATEESAQRGATTTQLLCDRIEPRHWGIDE